MTILDLKLIKLNTSHYYSYDGSLQDKILHQNKIFFNKFVIHNALLTADIIKRHWNKEIVVAHSLIRNKKVENIVIDYNGTDDVGFYHKAQLLLRKEGFLNWTAYRSKTRGHLHIYVHKGHTDLTEAILLAKTLSLRLEAVAPKQWRIFPTNEVPLGFNILALPYEVYAKERGSFWSKHL
ncbi:DUF1882 domain-containing protein [Helicobacter sp. 23-1045]